MENIESVWNELDQYYNKAESSLKSTAEDVWEFYHEVATSAAKSSYGSKMEYYTAVAVRYSVTDRTVRSWVAEGKRDKCDFLSRGTLNAIKWEETKTLAAPIKEVELSNDDLAASLDELVDLEELILDETEFKLDRVPSGGGGGSGSGGGDPSTEFGNRQELIEELEIYRSMGFSTPHEALVAVAKYRDISPVEKVLEKDDFDFLTQTLLEAASTLSLPDVSKLTTILGNLRKLVN